MDYYKGIVPGKDEPKGGGSYVKENLDAHEKYNFDVVSLSKDAGYPEGEYCLGFVETKSTNGETRNQLKIEKIDGCEAFKNETQVDDVLVVYCALYPDAIEKETKFKTVNGREFVISEMRSHAIVIHNDHNEKTTQVQG